MRQGKKTGEGLKHRVAFSSSQGEGKNGDWFSMTSAIPIYRIQLDTHVQPN